MERFWDYDGKFKKCYTEDYKLKKQLEDVAGVELQCKYSHRDGRIGWDFIYPKEKQNQIARMFKEPECGVDFTHRAESNLTVATRL